MIWRTRLTITNKDLKTPSVHKEHLRSVLKKIYPVISREMFIEEVESYEGIVYSLSVIPNADRFAHQIKRLTMHAMMLLQETMVS